MDPRNEESQPASESFMQDPLNGMHANMRPPDLHVSKFKPVNYSIQTGEEFALEFMLDRVNPRKPLLPNNDPNYATGYTEIKGILGISHTGSESGSDISMLTTVEKGPKEKEFVRNNSSLHEDRSNYGSLQSVPRTYDSSRGVVQCYTSSGASNNSLIKMKVLCSFGGKILPRPGDGKLRYVGGETRIISIRKEISWQELMQKTLSIYNQVHVIKYQLPGEDLDALVSVSCDEDLQNMMEECNELEDGEGSQKLRMFLFSMSDLDDVQLGLVNVDGDSEVQYVVAVNGMDIGSRRNSTLHGLVSSSANILDVFDGHDVERESRPIVDSIGVITLPLTGTIVSSSTVQSSQAILPSSSDVYEPHQQFDQGQMTYYGESQQYPLHHDQASHHSPFGGITTSVPPHGLMNQQGGLTEGQPFTGLQVAPFKHPKNITSDQLDDTNGHAQPIYWMGSTNEDVSQDIPSSGESKPVQGDILIDIEDRFSRNFLSDMFSRAVLSEDSSGVSPLHKDGAGLSINLENHEPKHWSYFQKLAQEGLVQKDVSLIDQDHFGFSPAIRKVEEGDHVSHPLKPLTTDGVPHSHVDSQLNFDEDDQKEPGMLGDSEVLHSNYGHSQVKGTESMQFDRMMENLRMPESEYEEVKLESRNIGLPPLNPSLGDVDISTLQIIMNEDLEELKELGSGTFGTVYHGKWRGTDTLEFWREADILSKLHHPNVVAFYGVVQDGPGGTLATVTEYMVDGSLRHVLVRKDRYLDRRKRLIIAMDAAFGMEYLHSKNIVHFDLKCDNLLVNLKDPSRPICKVGDFGLSKIKKNTLVSGGVRGTLPWMAPELLNGSSNKVSEKVDVFSFGIVLWEILTGEEPYANMHYGEIIGGIVNNTLRPIIPSYCDPEWRRLMEQCWAPNPAIRPSFTEIASCLRVMSAAASQTKAHGHKPSK
ncbi:hypothetical protein I3760_11G059200 [Carya illinoinensis]|nr:hypothetical protein I3760_11G059200 [Carya illinoinensis]